MKCTANGKDGADLLEQMRAAQPMPRGERLVEWEMRRDVAGPPRRKWYRLFTGSLVAFAVADKRLSHMPAIERIRLHAAPLALARERRRRERAEMNAKVLKSALSATDGMFHEAMARVQFAMADMAVAMSKTFAAWTFDHERACRMERDGVLTRRVWRLVTKRMSKPPTREEVERAVAELEEAYDALIYAPVLDVAANSRHQAARDAMVNLATRGAAPIHGATPQPPPVSSERSRDVLQRALEYARACDVGEEVPTAVEEIVYAICTTTGMAGKDIPAALEARAAVGLRKYGVPLRTHNGRDAREDLAEELLDAFMYATQMEMEEEDR